MGTLPDTNTKYKNTKIQNLTDKIQKCQEMCAINLEERMQDEELMTQSMFCLNENLLCIKKLIIINTVMLQKL